MYLMQQPISQKKIFFKRYHSYTSNLNSNSKIGALYSFKSGSDTREQDHASKSYPLETQNPLAVSQVVEVIKLPAIHEGIQRLPFLTKQSVTNTSSEFQMPASYDFQKYRHGCLYEQHSRPTRSRTPRFSSTTKKTKACCTKHQKTEVCAE